ncbi:MAG: TIR domain-containing protein [Anaerolineae bacterium]|nr:TIR domain-containing protein [Anaerolineae bacterium]
MAGSEQNIKVFISYRNIDRSKAEAKALAKKLRDEHGYEVFIDTDELKGGDIWEQKIYNNVRESDVLIVLIEQQTAESDWVQREVDVARGANVALLPLRITEETIDISLAQKKLAVDGTQFIPFSAADGDYARLVESIERLSKHTRDTQRVWMRDLDKKRRVKTAENDKNYKVYKLRGSDHRVRIHLATGDMTQLGGIDVLINSENDYMQMARIYESHALSSAIRREGSLIIKGRLREDSVQQELDDQISKRSEICGRPIAMGQVIVTHAGHPQSNLVQKQQARYVFHVATVRVDAMKMRERLTPIETDEGIREAVQNCLDMVLEVDRLKGVISPEGTPRAVEEKEHETQYKPINSIVFPLFGAGLGGRSTLEVLPPMLQSIKMFALAQAENPEFKLEHIYLCVRSKTDIPFAERLMSDLFEVDNDKPAVRPKKSSGN